MKEAEDFYDVALVNLAAKEAKLIIKEKYYIGSGLIIDQLIAQIKQQAQALADAANKQKDLYVAHIDTSIVLVGTKKECEDHRKSMPYPTDCWRISSLESYGESCWSRGNDSGYDEGSGD